jgi:hemerythrin-like domain-containing protein
MPKSEESMDAIELLKADHKKVKALFDDFEDTEDMSEKTQIAKQAIEELKIHAVIEEEIFYPAVRAAIDDEENIMNEAQEEHHVAKVLIAELDQMRDSDEHFEAKFIVLAESIRHHIKEEEGEMLPEAKKTDLDMDDLGAQMRERKQQLKAEGVPASKEEELVAHAR